MAGRPITPEEKTYAAELLARARLAQKQVEGYDQTQVDRLCQAIAWATANEKTFARIAVMGVDESGLGDPVGRVSKRFKIMGILRDVLRQKSVGIIEELPEKGIVKYGKPVTPFNGRHALKDAYEEVLDLAVYLKQKLVEDGYNGTHVPGDVSRAVKVG